MYALLNPQGPERSETDVLKRAAVMTYHSPKGKGKYMLQVYGKFMLT